MSQGKQITGQINIWRDSQKLKVKSEHCLLATFNKYLLERKKAWKGRKEEKSKEGRVGKEKRGEGLLYSQSRSSLRVAGPKHLSHDLQVPQVHYSRMLDLGARAGHGTQLLKYGREESFFFF